MSTENSIREWLLPSVVHQAAILSKRAKELNGPTLIIHTCIGLRNLLKCVPPSEEHCIGLTQTFMKLFELNAAPFDLEKTNEVLNGLSKTILPMLTPKPDVQPNYWDTDESDNEQEPDEFGDSWVPVKRDTDQPELDEPDTDEPELDEFGEPIADVFDDGSPKISVELKKAYAAVGRMYTQLNKSEDNLDDLTRELVQAEAYIDDLVYFRENDKLEHEKELAKLQEKMENTQAEFQDIVAKNLKLETEIQEIRSILSSV
jgi:hypothetical protein